jgi:hypothetical protein
MISSLKCVGATLPVLDIALLFHAWAARYVTIGGGDQRAFRSDLNAARSSALNSSGWSQAAKWPPLSTSWK